MWIPADALAFWLRFLQHSLIYCSCLGGIAWCLGVLRRGEVCILGMIITLDDLQYLHDTANDYDHHAYKTVFLRREAARAVG